MIANSFDKLDTLAEWLCRVQERRMAEAVRDQHHGPLILANRAAHHPNRGVRPPAIAALIFATKTSTQT